MVCLDAIDRLEALPVSEETVDLKREAGALGALFRSWLTRAPEVHERTAAVNRLMAMHRAVAELASRHPAGK